MISFEDVSFTYTNESYVLEDLSVEIPQGQFVCVLGANGSGKSTFSKLINALLLPDKGEVKVDGLITSDAQNTFSIRSKAGSVFQNPDDQIVASLVENDVAFGPENLGIPNPELRGTCTSWLDRLREARDQRAFRRPKATCCDRGHLGHGTADPHLR